MVWRRRFKRRRTFKKRFRRRFGGSFRRRYRRRGYRPTTQIIRRPSAFADRLFCKLRYVDRLDINSDPGPTNWVIRGNSLFDPDQTFVGHQPRGYDTYAGASGGSAPYGSYRVWGSKIRVTTCLHENNRLWVTAVLPSTVAGGTLSANTMQIAETPYLKYRYISSLQGGTSKGTVKHYMSTAKVWGQSKAAVKAESDFTSVYNSSPVKTWYWNILMDSPDDTNTNFDVIVEVTYYCEFFDRNEISAS